MNFKPELAAKVMAGEKTVTRRLMSDNPRSPWYSRGCSLRPGKTYAICPGRGKLAIGRVRILRCTRQPLHLVKQFGEARREGFETFEDFQRIWEAINGDYDPMVLVWRVEFEVVA